MIDKCCATLKRNMNNLIFPILTQLSDGKFHSGESLASQFGVTRATIWNAIQAIEQCGLEVFSVRGRGYQCAIKFTPLNSQIILQALANNPTQVTLEVHDTLASTNTYLMQQAAKTAQATCVVAQMQTGGRGRRGRTWQAGLGASLTFSLLWRFECGAAGLSGLSLAVGVALIRALNALGVNNAQLKWPNDVLVLQKQNPSQVHPQAQKLAGILIELQGDMDGPSVAVIGVGLNVNLPTAMQQSIDQATTDLTKILNAPVDANLVLATILKHLTAVLNTFEKEGFEALHSEWTQYHAYHQQAVNLLHPDGSQTHGVVKNVAHDGVLIVETSSGDARFMSGEISLRGALA